VSEQKRCFVIGPIGLSGSDIRKHSDMLLNVVIKSTLEQEEFGYHVFRADEVADPEIINDRVVHDIIHLRLRVPSDGV
jgi:hypothetical protein